MKKFPEKWSVRGGKNLERFFNQIKTLGLFKVGYYGDSDNIFYNFNGESIVFSDESDEPDYIVVTVEELIEHYLSPKEETRKIIGYKAPMGLFNDRVPKNTLYKVIEGKGGDEYEPGDLSYSTSSTFYMPKEIVETWEAVYEEEIKEGDYIYFITDVETGIKGKVSKITSIRSDSHGKGWINYEPLTKDGGGFRWEGNGYYLGKDFRKATSEEIEKIENIEIGGYKAEVYNNRIKFGCVSLNAQDLASYKFLITSDAKAEITVKGTKITYAMIDKLLNKLK